MAEKYGPEDSAVPAWEAPTGGPAAEPPRWSAPSPAGPRMPPGTQGPAPSGAQQAGIPTFRSWQPGFMPLRPLQLGDFISLPMKAIQANRAVIVGGPLLCMLVTLLTLSVAVWLVVVDLYNVLFGYTSFSFSMLTGDTILAIVIALVVLILADAAARIFIIPGVSRAILGERITLARAWEITRPRVLHVLLLYFFVILIAFGGMVVLSLVIAALVGAGGSAGAGFLVVLIVLAMIPFTFMATVIIDVAVTAVVLEKASAGAALGRAFSLIRGNAWRLTGCMLVIQLIVSVISQVASTVPSIALTAATGTSPSPGVVAVVSIVASWITLLVYSLINYSFLGTVTTLMYVDLRIRNEGFDVDLARAAEAAARR